MYNDESSILSSIDNSIISFIKNYNAFSEQKHSNIKFLFPNNYKISNPNFLVMFGESLNPHNIIFLSIILELEPHITSSNFRIFIQNLDNLIQSRDFKIFNDRVASYLPISANALSHVNGYKFQTYQESNPLSIKALDYVSKVYKTSKLTADYEFSNNLVDFIKKWQGDSDYLKDQELFSSLNADDGMIDQSPLSIEDIAPNLEQGLSGLGFEIE